MGCAGKAPAWRLFVSFLRLGVTAFGGPAMVAYIRDMAVKKKGWVSEESFGAGAALCQSIPGATSMQTAAYVGLRAGGPVGALAGFVGFGLPAFALMVALSAAYQAGHDLRLVLAGFRGLHVIVIAIIADAALKFWRSSVKNWRDGLLAALAAAFLVFHGSPVSAILGSVVVSLLLYHGQDLPWQPASETGGQGKLGVLRWAAGAALIVAAGLACLYAWNRRLLELGLVMLKVDVFAFGGGFASVPLMLHEVVNVRHWLDSRTFMDGIALGQVTPGPIVITAAFVGYQIAGVFGAVVGTIAIFTPSFLMVLIFVPYFDRLQHARLFRRSLRGVLASFVGLLAAAAIHFGLAVSWSIPAGVIAAAALAALRLKVDILWVVLAGAALSAVVL